MYLSLATMGEYAVAVKLFMVHQQIVKLVVLVQFQFFVCSSKAKKRVEIFEGRGRKNVNWRGRRNR
jgi:hypothetical protein